MAAFNVGILLKLVIFNVDKEVYLWVGLWVGGGNVEGFRVQ